MGKSTIKDIEKSAANIAEELGLELIDVEQVKEGPYKYLRIYIDRPGGIDLDECEKFHRRVMPLCEDVDYDFLECTSPGIDRPLKKDADFDRALGQRISVGLYKARDGQKSFEGILVGFDAQTLTVEFEGGEKASFIRAECSLITPVIAFEDI